MCPSKPHEAQQMLSAMVRMSGQNRSRQRVETIVFSVFSAGLPMEVPRVPGNENVKSVDRAVALGFLSIIISCKNRTIPAPQIREFVAQ
jgi:hypothetical protein